MFPTRNFHSVYGSFKWDLTIIDTIDSIRAIME